MTRGILATLKLDVELSGFEPGTPEFDRELRMRQVQACQDIRGVRGCSECPHQEHCALFRAYFADMTQTGVPK